MIYIRKKYEIYDINTIYPIKIRNIRCKYDTQYLRSKYQIYDINTIYVRYKYEVYNLNTIYKI